MAFDFPSDPVPDQVYTSPEGIIFQYNGYAWVRGGGGTSDGGFGGSVGQAYVISIAGEAVWGAPIDGGDF